ncbi:polysaccharide biosynthesis C-terminal domain-containing protein [Acaryochloris sp. IP29b_bin.137]|uniref:polysaccharide biosynthesis C-terminal domain-containing protein n=1 Tax=Acaryochloris sp. IP29b_bin.137 TaxID=2969217 RepID=UPI00262A91B3|nr:polysaccharide biosynthesis C-terminal domain-containing protein [Acaryochloris sp. IP29b_bin.137]
MGKVKRWLKKGCWALLDRGLFGLSNFALNVLLARWLPPHDYGVFTLFYSLFWLFGAFHTALFVEPLLVFGPGQYQDRFPAYLGSLVYSHFSFTFCTSGICLTAALMLGQTSVLMAPLIGIAVSGPFILLLWLMRQACYVQTLPESAAIAGSLYTCLMLFGMYGMHQYHWLSTASAFYVMGISSLVVGGWLTMQLPIDFHKAADTKLISSVAQQHWHFGRWSSATQLLMIAPDNIYYLALSTWGGLEATAALKALSNLNMPIARVNIALTSLLVPELVKTRGPTQFLHTVRIALLCFVLGPTLSWLCLGLMNQSIIQWLYQGNYQDNASLIWVIGISPIFRSIVVVFNATLRSLELPQKVFQAFCLFTPINLILTISLIWAYGVFGAVLGITLSAVLGSIVMTYFFVRTYKLSQ